VLVGQLALPCFSSSKQLRMEGRLGICSAARVLLPHRVLQCSPACCTAVGDLLGEVLAAAGAI
jgi:hypothetical protein